MLIKNMDWDRNPTEIEVKTNESEEEEILSIQDVQSFGIYGASKYIRKEVSMELSENQVGSLSNTSEPQYENEVVFLNVLIEGAASLFMYSDGYQTNYFYKVANSGIQPLIYKKYKAPDDAKIRENTRYRQQLWNDLKCPSFEINRFENIRYRKSDLLRLFQQYNECHQEEFTNFEQQRKEGRDLFNISVRPGFNYSTLSIRNEFYDHRDAESSQSSFRIGLEAEFILPFNQNKWALVVEPTYQSYKVKEKVFMDNADIDYQSLEIPMGVRHYFFLNEQSKLFVNGQIIIDINLGDSKIGFEHAEAMDVRGRNNLGFGAGYTFNNRYSIEFRYQTNREILSDYINWNSDYQTISVILGLRLF